MKVIDVRSFDELHNAFQKYCGSATWIFRGQCDDPSWTLVPKAGRGKIRIDDENLFRAWKRHAYAYEKRVINSDWEWLTIAQHHGLTTRLLDWTRNPLAATFFAIEHTQNHEGELNAAVFSYNNKAWGVGKADEPPNDPFKNAPIDVVKKFVPRSITQRLVMQQGIFTYHNPPKKSLESAIEHDEDLEKIVIPRNVLGEIRKILSYYGINKRTLFPDYDGLSEYMNWFYGTDYK